MPDPSLTTFGGAEAMQQVVRLMQEGRLDPAERLCLDILQHKPNDFDCTCLLGMLKAQRGDHDAALACFDRALSTHPRSYEVLYNRAATLYALKRRRHTIGHTMRNAWTWASPDLA